MGATELGEVLAEFRETGNALLQEAANLRGLLQKAEQTTQGLMLFEKTAADLLTALRTDREWFAKELQKAVGLFEGTQRFMLMNIEAAREEAREYKEALKKATDEADAWRFASQRRTNSLESVIAELRAKLEVYEQQATATSKPAEE